MTRKELYRKCELKLMELKHRYMKYVEDNRGPIKADPNRQRYLSLIPEILYALNRIRNGTYGICQRSGDEIESKRLLAVPWTRYSIGEAK